MLSLSGKGGCINNPSHSLFESLLSLWMRKYLVSTCFTETSNPISQYASITVCTVFHSISQYAQYVISVKRCLSFLVHVLASQCPSSFSLMSVQSPYQFKFHTNSFLSTIWWNSFRLWNFKIRKDPLILPASTCLARIDVFLKVFIPQLFMNMYLYTSFPQ